QRQCRPTRAHSGGGGSEMKQMPVLPRHGGWQNRQQIGWRVSAAEGSGTHTSPLLSLRTRPSRGRDPAVRQRSAGGGSSLAGRRLSGGASRSARPCPTAVSSYGLNSPPPRDPSAMTPEGREGIAHGETAFHAAPSRSSPI